MSWRDIVLAGGGLFLLVKGTMEMHHMLEGYGGEGVAGTASFAAVIAQIVMLDVVFSLDSVITAVGIAEHIPVMVGAIVIAMAVMLLAAEPTARFVNAHPTVKMLALSFLLLVGVALIADGLHLPHPPRLPVFRDRVLDRRRIAEPAGRPRAPAPRRQAPGLRPRGASDPDGWYRGAKTPVALAGLCDGTLSEPCGSGNVYSPSCSACSRSSCPVASQNARKSRTVPGSVASTRSTSPAATPCIALRARSTGSGHLSPRVSSRVSGMRTDP